MGRLQKFVVMACLMGGFVVNTTGGISTVWAESKFDPKRWQTLLDEARILEDKQDEKQQLLRAQKLWQAYTMNPKPFASIEAALISCSIRADFSTKPDKIKMWAKSGWVLAEQMIKRWPARGEGYFWASIHIGQYARGGGVWVALTQGLANKIENMALLAIKKNPKVYQGAPHRVLGRYYFKIPWPWRHLKKSISYLEEAHRQSPRNIGGMRFLAETLLASGQKQRAITLFRSCAQHWYKGLRPTASSSRCRAWLQKHRH